MDLRIRPRRDPLAAPAWLDGAGRRRLLARHACVPLHAGVTALDAPFCPM
jgi:hypothetical protein